MKAAAIIPARYASTRFPGKPLAKLQGKPIIQWVWERRIRSKASLVLIATDDSRIAAEAEKFGASVVMTSPNHPTGSDRIWEAAQQCADCDVIINVQGDEPLIEPAVINALIDVMFAQENTDMATAVVPMSRAEIADNPNLPKVVVAADDTALYFSRAPIPFLRQGGTEMTMYRHWGIYAYRRCALERFVSLPESPLEKCEKLEQLRALENGMRIKVIRTSFQSIGIDTPEDLVQAEEFVRNHPGL